MTRARLTAVGLAVLCLFVASVAEAADPPSGTLSNSKRSLKWTGSFTLSEPNSLPSAGYPDGCLAQSDDPICDHFMLTVNLGDGARIRLALPAPDETTDIDLFVYSPTGALVGKSTNGPGTDEFVSFRHTGRFRNMPYEVDIVPYLVVPGTTYGATAKVL